MPDYGHEPEILGYYDFARGAGGAQAWDEYMNYQYVPIQMPEYEPKTYHLERGKFEPTAEPHREYVLPVNLYFAKPMIEDAIAAEHARAGHWWDHLYVTAKHAFATPGNPLNRPGWHADGFGTDDVNYVWVDRYSTEFAISVDHGNPFGPSFRDVPEGDAESLAYFEQRIEDFGDDFKSRTYTDGLALRLDAGVIHAAPPIPAPGGDRRFLKLSFATSRYNLRGNAHNYGIPYDWPMHDRQAARNVTNADHLPTKNGALS